MAAFVQRVREDKSLRVKLVLYLLAMLCFVLYLVFAPRLVDAVTGHGAEARWGSGAPALYTGGGGWYMDWEREYDDLNLTHTLCGWVYLNDFTDYPESTPEAEINAAKAVELVFVKGDESYTVAAEMRARPTVRDSIGFNPYIRGVMHEFYREFSTLSIPHGDYQLYIQVAENEGVQGAIDTGTLYRKDGKGLHPLEGAPVEAEGPPAVFDGASGYWIDSQEIKEGLYVINGWAVLDDPATPEESDPVRENPGKTMRLYLVSDKNSYVFPATLGERPGLDETLDDVTVRGVLHGFESAIAPGFLEAGEYRLYIDVWENEQTHGAIDTGIHYVKEAEGNFYLVEE